MHKAKFHKTGKKQPMLK